MSLHSFNLTFDICKTCKADEQDGGVKIAVGHWIFLTDLIKSLISYVDKFSEMPDSKKKN